MVFPLDSFLLAHSVPVTNTPNLPLPRDLCTAVSSKRRLLLGHQSGVNSSITSERFVQLTRITLLYFPNTSCHHHQLLVVLPFLLGPKKPHILSTPALHSAAFKVAGASRGSCADTAAPPSQPQLLWLPGCPLADLPAKGGARSRPEDELNMGGTKYVQSYMGSWGRGTVKNGSGAGARVRVSQGLHLGVRPNQKDR